MNLDVQDWKTKHFAREVLQTKTFAEVGLLMILFFMISAGLGNIFHVDLGIFGTQPVIWHAWWLHFGVLGNLRVILGRWGTQERTL